MSDGGDDERQWPDPEAGSDGEIPPLSFVFVGVAQFAVAIYYVWAARPGYALAFMALLTTAVVSLMALTTAFAMSQDGR